MAPWLRRSVPSSTKRTHFPGRWVPRPAGTGRARGHPCAPPTSRPTEPVGVPSGCRNPPIYGTNPFPKTPQPPPPPWLRRFVPPSLLLRNEPISEDSRQPSLRGSVASSLRPFFYETNPFPRTPSRPPPWLRRFVASSLLLRNEPISEDSRAAHHSCLRRFVPPSLLLRNEPISADAQPPPLRGYVAPSLRPFFYETNPFPRTPSLRGSVAPWLRRFVPSSTKRTHFRRLPTATPPWLRRFVPPSLLLRNEPISADAPPPLRGSVAPWLRGSVAPSRRSLIRGRTQTAARPDSSRAAVRLSECLNRDANQLTTQVSPSSNRSSTCPSPLLPVASVICLMTSSS